MIALATTVAELTRVECRLVELGASVVRVAAPGGSRRVVLASIPPGTPAGPVVNALRSEGEAAVVRPESGPRLDAWRRDTRPIRWGSRLTVCPAWSEHDRDPLAGLIEIGPGGFGNGGHPTTRMLLDMIVEQVQGAERVLDLGCGSGLLGLAALRVGAGEVVGVDVKPEAVDATRRNAALNGLADRLDATDAKLDELSGPFDAIVANVGRAVLVELSPTIRSLLAADGWLAISGFSSRQCSLMAGHLRPLVEQHRRTDGEWAAMDFRHPDA